MSDCQSYHRTAAGKQQVPHGALPSILPAVVMVELPGKGGAGARGQGEGDMGL